MANYGGISAGQLRQFIERIERLEEEKAMRAEDIREVFSEAKANGFDVKIMRQVIKLRKMDQSELAEHEEILDLYRHALGMIAAPTEAEDKSLAEELAGDKPAPSNDDATDSEDAA